jgi:hypothetical protein
MGREKKIILMMLLILLLTCSGCLDHDFKLFQKNLKLTVLLDNPKQLFEGAPVLLLVSEKNKQKIGEVKKISKTSNGLSSVEIHIANEFKKQMSTGKDFVFYSNPLGGETDHILVVDSLNNYSFEPLEQGAVIRGKSYVEYSIGKTGKGLHKWLKKMADTGNDLLQLLEREIEEFDVDLLKKQLDLLQKDVGEFSEQQRQMFEKNILPELKKRIEDIIKFFEHKLDEQDLQKLRKRFSDIEKMVTGT